MSNPVVPRCPTCAKPLGPTLTEQILSILAEMGDTTGLPVSYTHLRKQTGKSGQAVVNALQRLSARGAIRKTTRVLEHGIEVSGWVLTPQRLPEPDRSPEEDLLTNLQSYVEAAGGVARESAERFLLSIGATPDQAKDAIESAVEVGMFSEFDGRLHA